MLKKFSAFSVFFILGSIALIVFAVVATEDFESATKSYPFFMGFIKFFLLGTLGELLKHRLSHSDWKLDFIVERSLVWGVFGIWFTLIFAGFSILVDGLIEINLWPSGIAIVPDFLWVAFSKGLWLNVLGMYGWGMMVSHEYFNFVIKRRWKVFALNKFAEHVDTKFILSFIPKTLVFFWIPANSFTFVLPYEWRVFAAALLAVALGFFLSVGKKSAGKAKSA